MFKFVQTASFQTTVEAALPSEDGTVVEGSFKARFKHVGRERFLELQQAQGEALGQVSAVSRGEDASLAALLRARHALLEEVLEGVSGIGDGQGEYPADQQRDIVLGHPALINLTAEAFFGAYNGAARGNSKPSRGR